MKRVIRGGFGLLMAMLLIAGLVPAGVSAAASPSVTYRTHVENEGWQNFAADGNTSGTSGKGYRLEGIEVKLDTQGYNLGITYQTHIQNIGWESETSRGWKSNGIMSGTEGLGYRLEAIQIKLTGNDAGLFDIYYQVHAQNMGWLGWAKNGESAGTAGYGYRLEAIKIVVVPKGSAAPGGTVDQAKPFYENPAAPYAQILQEYQIAEANGFSRADAENLPNVNMELSYSSYKTKLYYIVEDISGDSTPELVIAMYNPKYISQTKYGYQIYDMYKLEGGHPVRVFDINSMGYRAVYTICETQMIRMRGSGGAKSGRFVFYKLNGNTVTTYQSIQYETWTAPNYFLTDANHNNSQITETEAFSIINSYIPRSDINWIAL